MSNFHWDIKFYEMCFSQAVCSPPITGKRCSNRKTEIKQSSSLAWATKHKKYNGDVLTLKVPQFALMKLN